MARAYFRSCGARRTWDVLIVSLAVVFAGGTNAWGEQAFSWLGAAGGPVYKWSGGGNWDGGVAPPSLGASDIHLLFDGAPTGLNSTNDFDKFQLNRLQFGTTAGNYQVGGATGTHLLNFVADGATMPTLLNDSNSTILLPHFISFESGLDVGGAGVGSVALTGDIIGRGVLTKSGAGTATFDHPAADLQLDELVVTGGVLNVVGGTEMRVDTTATSNLSGGTINVDGPGSLLSARFNSEFLAHDDGTLNITNGGKLESFGGGPGRVFWGRNATGRSVVVDGAGSTWEHIATISSHRLQVRRSHTTVTISNGGAFSTSGMLFVEGGASFTVDGGTASVGSLDSQDADGLVEISDAGMTSALTITNAVSLIGDGGFDGIIADGPGGAGSITLTGGQQWINGLANSYSGGTRLLGGELVVAGSDSLGSGPVLLDGGGMTFANSGVLDAGRVLTFGPNGATLGAVNGATLTVLHTLNLTTPLTITDSGTVRLTGANQYDSLSLAGGTLELTHDADATVGGTLMGNAGKLAKFGDGTLTLTQEIADGVNVNGGIVIVHEGALRLTHARAMNDNIVDLQTNDGLVLDLGPSPAVVPLQGLQGSGNVDLGAHSLVLKSGPLGATQYTGTIQGAGSVTVHGNAQLMGINAYTGGTILNLATLTFVPGTTAGDIDASAGGTLIMHQDADGTFAGDIVGNVTAFKQGAGMLTLTASGGYNNVDFELLEGGLAMAAGANGLFTGGSVFTLHGGTTFRALSDGASTFEFFQSSTLDTNGHRVRSGFIFASDTHNSIVTKTGAGVFSVDSGIVYGFNVVGGTLELAIHPIASFSVGDVQIADGASLTGSTTLNDLSETRPSRLILESGGALAPGLPAEPIGTMSATSLLWDDGGILHFDLADADASDRLALPGQFGKGAAGTEGYLFDLSVIGSVDAGVYQLVTFGSTDFVVSDFDYFGLPAGAVGEFELQAGALVLYLTVQPGDYDLSGGVDAADYTVWRDSLGQSDTGLAADGNGNGSIDSGDYEIWKAHFGQIAGSGGSASGNAAVPEPGAWILLLAAQFGLLPNRRDALRRRFAER